MSSPQFDPVPMAPSPGAVGAPESAGQEGNPIREAIAEAIAEHRVILFMKGTPEAPACGFSARTVAILQSLETPFAAVDILPDPRIRQELSALSAGPRSRSCSWTESWSAGATSSPRCTSRESSRRPSASSHGAAAAAGRRSPRAARGARHGPRWSVR